MTDQAHRVWLEVNLSTLAENFRKIRKHVSPLNVMAVLKANAYGLGVEQAASVLNDAGAAGFCVAELREALPLLKYGKPVQILGGVLDFELPSAVEHGIILGLTGFEAAKKISEEAVRQKKTVECHFKLDTGMGRMGILAEQAETVIPEILTLPNLDCCGIYTHFPASENGENDANKAQIERFLKVIRYVKSLGVNLRKVHMANSDGINLCPSVLKAPFTHVRAGIDLHGSFNPTGNTLGLQSTVTLKSRLISTRMMPAGHGIGYCSTCILKKDTLVGTVTAGYADGLPLQLSNRGAMIVRGKLCPILGRISMDYTTISLEGFQEGELHPGEEVTLIGTSSGVSVSLEDWAKLKGTHPYDVLCSFGPRVDRTYCKGE